MTLSLPAFAARHIGPREDDLDAMLQVVGAASLEALAAAAIPDDIRAAEAFDRCRELTLAHFSAYFEARDAIRAAMQSEQGAQG